MISLPFIGAHRAAVLAYVLFDGFDLGVGILFPSSAPSATRSGHELGGSRAGRQRDLAGAGRRRGDGGFPSPTPLSMTALRPIIAICWRSSSAASPSSSAGAPSAIPVGLGLHRRLDAGGLRRAWPSARWCRASPSPTALRWGWWDWLTPFSLLTGIALVIGYALLGATWLIMKTSGDLQERARRFAWITALGTLALIGVVSLWTPLMNSQFMARWFAWPAILYSAPVPLLVALAAFALFSGLVRRREAQPFLAAIALFVLSYAGLGISFYPYIVPPSITIWSAAAPDSSLKFLLVGAVILVPLILAYTAWSYWVFRGKVDPSAGYH
jgi:cytochrome d ubiquinol oxidase subunit II